MMDRGIATIFQRQVILCQIEGNHQIVMSTYMLCLILNVTKRGLLGGGGSHTPLDPPLAMPLMDSKESTETYLNP